jgi:hypothetical protein
MGTRYQEQKEEHPVEAFHGVKGKEGEGEAEIPSVVL